MSYPEDIPPRYPDDVDTVGAAAPPPRDPIATEADPMIGREPTQQLHRDDPARDSAVRDDQNRDRPLTDRGHGDHETSDIVKQAQRPDNQARLLLGIAAISAITLLWVLIGTITLLAQGNDDEPVLVDGVPCLVQDGPADGEDAVLYCQR
ncbi:MAG: hypothetical protein ACR2HR_10420 [Euzebya sp.]